MLCLDLENIQIKFDEEDRALILLQSFPKNYDTFVDIRMKHGRDSIKLDDVIDGLNAKELKKKKEKQKGDNMEFYGKGLSIRGRIKRESFEESLTGLDQN